VPGTPPTPPNIPRSEPSSRGVPISWIVGSMTAVLTTTSSAGAPSTTPSAPRVPMLPHRMRAPPTPVNRRASLSPAKDADLHALPCRARAPRVPLPRVRRSQQRSLTSSGAGYPQVGVRAGQYLIAARSFQLIMSVRFQSSLCRTQDERSATRSVDAASPGPASAVR
jgi:hypothetical protein